MKFLAAWNARLLSGLLALAAVQIFILGFLVTADVIGRTIFNTPVRGTAEIVAMSIVSISFLLAGYSVHSGGMLRSSIPEALLGPRGYWFSRLLSAILGAAFFAIILFGSLEPTLHSWRSGEYEGAGSLRVPAWPARATVLIGSLLVTLTYLGQAITATMGLFGSASGPIPEPEHKATGAGRV